MLALATMLPAMAENWTLASSYLNPYEDLLHPSPEYTNPSNYTFYVMLQENSDKETVKTRLEGTTFSEFTTTIAGCKEVKFKEYYDWINLFHTAYDVVTEFPSSIDPRVNIWGVCIYEHEDFVRFQVVPVHDLNEQIWFIHFDTSRTPGTGYTSFKTVPEPATATLSLLALAGLAARRKRE